MAASQHAERLLVSRVTSGTDTTDLSLSNRHVVDALKTVDLADVVTAAALPSTGTIVRALVRYQQPNTPQQLLLLLFLLPASFISLPGGRARPFLSPLSLFHFLHSLSLSGSSRISCRVCSRETSPEQSRPHHTGLQSENKH